MNGCGTRWLGRLQPLARYVRTRKALPCSVARSLSHGSCLLNRVTRRKHVSGPGKPALEDGARFITPEDSAVQEPPDDFVPGPLMPVKEGKDAEGRKYFMSGSAFKYHVRHGRSVEGGYVKAVYTARNAFLNPSTKVFEYGRPIKRPLLILYNCNFVEDDEFWDEISTICDFATSFTEREKDLRGFAPERDSRPVEFVYVQARYHHNAYTPGEPWHITLDLGNRQTWNDGKGFFRRDYHIYAKNDDLSQGYAGYTSASKNSRETRDIDLSEWDKGTDDITFVPWGCREWFRHPHYRKVLFESTQRSLLPPASSQWRKSKSWILRPNPTTGALEKVEFTSIPDQLDGLLNSIREGASKPASPAERTSGLVIDHSGNRVHVNEAVKNAIKEGKDVLPAWKILVQNLHARLTKELKASQSARSKTARAPGITRPTSRLQKRSPRPNESGGSDNSSAQQQESHSRSDEGFGIREEHTDASEPGSGGDIKSQPQGSMVPQRPEKSQDTTRTSGTKLTISDIFDRDAGVRPGGSVARTPASGEASARPRTKKYRKSPSGNLLSDSVSPGSESNVASPLGFGSTGRKPGIRTHGPGARKPGKKFRSPLPHAAADLSCQEPKNMGPSREARGPKKAASDSKSPPAWASPRDSKEAALGEVHP